MFWGPPAILPMELFHLLEVSAPRLPYNFMVGQAKCRMSFRRGKIPLIVLHSNSKQLLQCREDIPGALKFMLDLAEQLKTGRVALSEVKEQRQKWLEVFTLKF